ncbi:MAG: SDR family oxidoreductase [Alphaproteobacteria bacterium]
MKVALITGGSRGLGKSMAQHLASHGTDVIITYQSQKAAADTLVQEIQATGRKAVALSLDITKRETFADFASQIQAALKTVWKRSDFDYLVNNAGMGMPPLMIAETTPEIFDRMVDAHLKAPFFLTQKLLPLMKDGGRILNISSGLARFSYPGFGAYAMMKGGIEVFTRYLAKELGGRKIAVNTIAPGAIATDFGGGRVRDDAELNKMIASQTALGRVGVPDDIGGAVAAILADESGWINGQCIEVSGGIHL